MKLSRLIEELTEAQEYFGDDFDPEVRLAIQPSWPFEHTLCAVHVSEIDNEDETAEVKDPVVYLGEGRQIGYLPESATGVWSR